jgi:hypothetical protein
MPKIIRAAKNPNDFLNFFILVTSLNMFSKEVEVFAYLGQGMMEEKGADCALEGKRRRRKNGTSSVDLTSHERSTVAEEENIQGFKPKPHAHLLAPRAMK